MLFILIFPILFYAHLTINYSYYLQHALNYQIKAGSLNPGRARPVPQSKGSVNPILGGTLVQVSASSKLIRQETQKVFRNFKITLCKAYICLSKFQIFFHLLEDHHGHEQSGQADYHNSYNNLVSSTLFLCLVFLYIPFLFHSNTYERLHFVS